MYIYRGVFTVGIAVINGKSAIGSSNAISNYSYVYAKNGTGIIARCVTGLGPNGSDNSVLGGLYFNDSRIQHGTKCADSQDIISKPGTRTAGVINIKQCRQFPINAEGSISAEGVYTCTMMKSSMMNESIKFGVYFIGRSEFLDLYIPLLAIFTSLHSLSSDR